MANTGTEWQVAGFQKALKEYLNLKKNVDPKKELRRRAKNIGMRLIKLYKDKGVVLSDISEFHIGDTIKIRPKIWAKAKKNPKKWTYKRMVRAELNARRSAKGFTSTGWFPSVTKLGGSPKRQLRAGGGPHRGSLEERLCGNDISETLVNSQPGAGHVHDKNKGDFQNALNQETEDIVKYVAKKQNEAARKVGL